MVWVELVTTLIVVEALGWGEGEAIISKGPEEITWSVPLERDF